MFPRLAVPTVVLLLIAISGTANAQDTAVLRGEVNDAYGSGIPAAEVTATSNATGTETTGSTDAVGSYRLTLEAGVYTVTVEASGFEAATASDVELMVGQTVVRNFSLELGAVTTSIVVVGSRAEPRSVTESTVPVDVIRTEDFASQGSRDLATQLRAVVPSFNVNTQPISDASTIVRPVMLRNLAPDHTLVLVNGKRRHRSSIIDWHGGNGVAFGSQGPDISGIPAIALRQAEVAARRSGRPVRLRRHCRSHQSAAQRQPFGRQSGVQCGYIPGGMGRGHLQCGRQRRIAAGLDRFRQPQLRVRRRRADRPQHSAQRRGGPHGSRQYPRAGPRPDLGLTGG